MEMPVCTRWWTAATVVTGVLVQCEILTPFQLFYSFRVVFQKQQVSCPPVSERKDDANSHVQFWRLATTFIYFGPLSMNLLFHIFFIQRYARMLEEAAASVAHFSWLLTFISVTLLSIAPIFSQAFLGTTLSSTLVYIWSRRNPDTRLSFMGLVAFKAPWLPWVLVAFNVVLNGYWPKDELCGIAVGHGGSNSMDMFVGHLLTSYSLVLLQRHLPIDAQRTSPVRAATMVDPFIRGSCASGRRNRRACCSYQSRHCCTHGPRGAVDVTAVQSISLIHIALR